MAWNDSHDASVRSWPPASPERIELSTDILGGGACRLRASVCYDGGGPVRITIGLCPAEEAMLAQYIKERGMASFPLAVIAKDLLVAGLMARALAAAKRKGKS